MEGQGYSHGSSKLGGTKKSSARSADLNSSTGNNGEPIKDTGVRTPKGNKKTRGASDRYK